MYQTNKSTKFSPVLLLFVRAAEISKTIPKVTPQPATTATDFHIHISANKNHKQVSVSLLTTLTKKQEHILYSPTVFEPPVHTKYIQHIECIRF